MVTEELTIDWAIYNFAFFADSKDVGYSQLSPSFKFYVASLRKMFAFSLTVYPKGMEPTSSEQSATSREDQIGIFLNNNNDVK